MGGLEPIQAMGYSFVFLQSPLYHAVYRAVMPSCTSILYVIFLIPFTITAKFEVSADQTWGSWGGSVVVYCGSIASPDYITFQ
jgi:hypothetical protein